MIADAESQEEEGPDARDGQSGIFHDGPARRPRTGREVDAGTPEADRQEGSGGAVGTLRKLTYAQKMKRLCDRARAEEIRAMAGPRESRTKMPTKVSVARYWCARPDFMNLFWEEPGCFGCGAAFGVIGSHSFEDKWTRAVLERAHLIPHAFGGPAKVENLVLLCPRCHREAPSVGLRPDVMIDWINRREAWSSIVWRRFLEECASISPDLIERVAYSVWAPFGQTIDEQIEDFCRKAELMARHLRIGYHTGGDPISTVVAIIAAMGELALPGKPRPQKVRLRK